MDSNRDDRSKPAAGPDEGDAQALAAVAEAVTRLDFGVIGLTVHNGRVVQLDVTERRRFT